MARFLHLRKAPERVLRLGGRPQVRSIPHALSEPASKGLIELVGKTVIFAIEGTQVAGKGLRIDGKDLVVNLAVPGRDGLLYLSDSEHRVSTNELEVSKALMSERRAKYFEAGANVTLPAEHKAMPVMEGDGDMKRIVDYRDVIIEGFASTFVSTTPGDRIGDYIIPGAFDDTLTDFAKNPVILCDHNNSVKCLAGSWENVAVNQRGLAVRGRITNAPDMRDVRFKLVEKHLRGLSIGGIWYYGDDGREIHRATLYEISLTPIPMNPDALLTRSLDAADCRKAFDLFRKGSKALKQAA